MPKPTFDPVTDNCRTDGPAHREADPRRFLDAVPHQQVTNEQRPSGPAARPDRSMELRAAAHPRTRRQHRTSPPRSRRQRRSDADPRTALTAACSEDCTTGTGAHAQPEAVRLCPTPIVRLERALAHRKLQMRVKDSGQPPSRGYRHTTTLACAGTTFCSRAASRPHTTPSARRPGARTPQ